MNKEARTVFNTIQALITTRHQLQTFNALIAAFLEADGNPRPEHAPVKSPSAFSRFLNRYDWNVRAIVRAVRAEITKQLWAVYAQRKGRKSILEIIIDLTTLEKTGAFENLEIHQLKDKIGLHLVVLYVVVGVHRFPWSLAVWRGKNTPSAAKLALRLLSSIPAWWSERLTVRVLADSGFDSDEFIDGVNGLGFHGVIGSRANRAIGPGKHLSDLCCKGSEVQFKSCETPVFASWFKREQPGRCCLVSKKLKRARGESVWRYVISTRRADGETIRRWGRRRWRIEGFFKTMKFRFGLDQFGQRTVRGAFRFIVLGLLAFMLAFWEALEMVADWALLDWGLVARGAADGLVPEIQALEAQRTLDRLRPILAVRGMAC